MFSPTIFITNTNYFSRSHWPIYSYVLRVVRINHKYFIESIINNQSKNKTKISLIRSFRFTFLVSNYSFGTDKSEMLQISYSHFVKCTGHFLITLEKKQFCVEKHLINNHIVGDTTGREEKNYIYTFNGFRKSHFCTPHPRSRPHTDSLTHKTHTRAHAHTHF